MTLERAGDVKTCGFSSIRGPLIEIVIQAETCKERVSGYVKRFLAGLVTSGVVLALSRGTEERFLAGKISSFEDVLFPVGVSLAAGMASSILTRSVKQSAAFGFLAGLLGSLGYSV